VASAFVGDEPRVVAVMDRHDLGFLVAGGLVLENHQPVPPGVPRAIGTPPSLNPEYMRQMPLAQLLIGGSGLPGVGVPHAARLTPIYASRSVAAGLQAPLPVTWVFERVAGAGLHGQALPGSRVVAEISLVEWGRPHRYRAWTDAAADGSWRMDVALPSGFHRSTLHSGDAWTVRRTGMPDVTVRVPEEAVRRGSTIEVGGGG
jgi:hypothetical protein